MTRAHPRDRERGTTTLEVVGMAPLVMLLVVILLHVAAALFGITTAQTAARQGARAYSQDDSTATAFSVVDQSVPAWIGVDPGDVEIVGPGHGVRVHLDIPDVIPGYNLVVTRETVMP